MNSGHNDFGTGFQDQRGSQHADAPEICMDLSCRGETSSVPAAGADEDGTVLEETINEPKEGMRFEMLSDLINFYREYGRGQGFQTKIKGVDLKIVPDEEQLRNPQLLWDLYASRCRLECSKAGKFKSRKTNPKRNTRSIKSGCNAKLNAWRGHDGIWRITKVVKEHNHETLPHNSRFIANYREISTRNRGRLITNKLAGIPTNKSFLSIVMENGGFENTGMLEKDCRNMLDNERRLRLSEGDFVAMKKYFEDMSRRCKDFLYVYDTTNEGRLRNVFWCDGRSRSAYKDFGDVVSFDTTYLKNRYKMPFATFIGVNHHGQSILFGCALLSGEDTENFEWVFDQWKTCMSGNAPIGIITDQCKAIGNAIAHIFPDTKHRLCLWHIMQNANKHLHHLQSWEEIELRIGSVLHDSLTKMEFEHAWTCMLAEFGLQKNKWLEEVYSIREMWVPVYFTDRFWAGMSTTQRSEGMNNFFKSFVSLNSTLTEFALQFSLALAKRVQDEAQETFTSKNSPIQLSTDFIYEKVFQEFYTNTKFAEVKEQLVEVQYMNSSILWQDNTISVYLVSDQTKKTLYFRPAGVNLQVRFDRRTTSLECECRRFEFRGILCSHVFKVMFQIGLKYVPTRYVLERWRKDVPRNYLKYTVPHYNPDSTLAEPHTFKMLSTKFDEVVHLMLGEQAIAHQFMAVMDEFKAKAIASATKNSRIDMEEVAGGAFVYRRRTSQLQTSTGEVHQREQPELTQIVDDPPDQRGHGPTPTKRKGYRKPGRGGKYRGKKQVTTASNTPPSMKRKPVNTSLEERGTLRRSNPTIRVVEKNTIGGNGTTVYFI